MPELELGIPEKCAHCGMTAEEMKEQYGVPFIVLGQPNTLLLLFQCPNCHCVMGNTKAAENVKKLMEEQEKRSPILKPPGRIILPGHPKMN
jgi:hypothetical protein